MTPAEFRALTPLPAASAALRALWRDAQGDWDGAHKCVDALEDPESCWAHAFLHRKEGDLANARYWYRRAGRAPFDGPPDDEWTQIAAVLLARETPA